MTYEEVIDGTLNFEKSVEDYPFIGEAPCEVEIGKIVGYDELKNVYQKTKNDNVRLCELHAGDVFSCDIFHPPISIPVVIHGVDFYYIRKWYNPVSWFKKHWVTKYEYICCNGDNKSTI